MAKIELTDGRRIPVVQPTLWDAVEVQKEMGWTAKKYAEMSQYGGVQQGIQFFASFRRAGIETTFQDCMEVAGIVNVIAQPGDIARAQGIEESEGEETPDPPRSSTPAVDDAETVSLETPR